MWFAVLALICSIIALAYVWTKTHMPAPTNTSTEAGDAHDEHPVQNVARPVQRPFELPTYDPAGADADKQADNVYATVTRMRDPKNWNNDA